MFGACKVEICTSVITATKQMTLFLNPCLTAFPVNLILSARKKGIPVILNDRPEEALMLGCSGVHLGKGDLSAGAARALMGKLAVIGRTIRNARDLAAARVKDHDYVSIGPVFRSPLKAALKSLRLFSRAGPLDELDLEETIDETCKNAGEIELVWKRSRRNRVKLLLLMDVGGSMNPHVRVCSRLFSAAHSATHFRDFQYYYFHNCIYDKLYKDIERGEPVFTNNLLLTLPGDYKVIIVGDASMAASELMSRHGAIYYQDMNETPGVEWLKRREESLGLLKGLKKLQVRKSNPRWAKRRRRLLRASWKK